MTEIDESRVVDREISQPSVRETALEKCCENYEVAIRSSQREVKEIEKQLKAANRKFEKLIKIVANNARNSEAILKQI